MKDKIISKNKGKEGVALVTTVIVLTVVLILATLALFLVSKTMIITTTQKTIGDAFAMSEYGIQEGMQTVQLAFSTGSNTYLGTKELNKEGFKIIVFTRKMASTPLAGGYIGFAEAYKGVAKSAVGSTALEYLIISEAVRDNLRYELHTLLRRVPNVPGG